MMTLPEFETALDLYGSRLNTWPEHLRGQAKALAETGAGREVLSRASRVDRLLEGLTEAEPLSAAQIGRLMSGIRGRGERLREPLYLFRTGQSLVAALSVAVVIFGFGVWSGTANAVATDQIDLAALDFEAAGLVIAP